jgi:hypothetical protein
LIALAAAVENFADRINGLIRFRLIGITLLPRAKACPRSTDFDRVAMKIGYCADTFAAASSLHADIIFGKDRIL